MTRCDRSGLTDFSCLNPEHQSAGIAAMSTFDDLAAEDARFVWATWCAINIGVAHPWDWASPHECIMLHQAGVSAGDIRIAVDRWQTARTVTSDWGFIRTVAWNEALKRRENLAGIEHGSADEQRRSQHIPGATTR